MIFRKTPPPYVETCRAVVKETVAREAAIWMSCVDIRLITIFCEHMSGNTELNVRGLRP
jgi:hypothetical protein